MNKVLTIYQPSASLIVVGAKKFETRPWRTHYRGELLIHAGLKLPAKVLYPWAMWKWRKLYEALGDKKMEFDADKRFLMHLPRGAIIAKCELVGCHKIDAIQELEGAPYETGYWTGLNWHDITQQEELFGDWRAGRWAWELANVEPIEPIFVSGKQGLWNYEGEIKRC